MKLIEGIKSTTRPEEIDTHSSETTVFVRSNIKEEVEIDPIFNTKHIVYTYDETQYTVLEWTSMKLNELFTKIEEINKIIEPFKNIPESEDAVDRTNPYGTTIELL